MNFTDEEKAWIRAHPTVYFASDDQFPPIEYVVKGEYRGLVAEYLSAVAHQSGLKFERVPTTTWAEAQNAFLSGKALLIPNVSVERVLPLVAQNMLLSEPYFTDPTIIVTRADEPIILNPGNLAGKTVEMRGGGSNGKAFAERYPKIHVHEANTPDQVLDAVFTGEAYAAIGTEMAFLPLLRRRYAHKLSVSGTVVAMPFVVQMATRKDAPLLQSIVTKSLGVLSAEATDKMWIKWLGETDYGRPSILSIVQYHAPALMASLAAFALLALFGWQAWAAKARAQANEQEKTRFLAMMSHEIRTPMNAILGCVDLLRRSTLDQTHRRLASTAAAAADALLGLLDNVLDLSKLNAHSIELERLPTDLSALTSQVVEIARLTAQEKQLEVYFAIYNPDRLYALVDPTRLRQVLMNLMGNAIKFTTEGRVHLAMTLTTDDVSTLAGSLKITVTDTGIGIATGQLHKLFKPYGQADESTTRLHGGTGLGLSICKELVELMGGTITLRSIAGEGTAVTVHIPTQCVASPKKRKVDKAIVLDEPQIDSGVTVLVVEDHADNQFVIAQQLKHIGVHSYAALDGAAALAALAKYTFGLILMDCHMPGKSGYEMAQQIRADEKAAGSVAIPIIAISAVTDASHLERCFASGMDGVLTKPLRIDELHGIFSLWIPNYSGSLNELYPVVAPSLEVIDLRTLYQDSLADNISSLARAIEHIDVQQAVYLAHRIHGAALMVGSVAITRAAAHIERKVAVFEDADREELQAAMTRLWSAYEAWVRQQSSP